jgi:heptosyltransferase-2
VNRLVILAPNWLGDAVMALPAVADVRRQVPVAEIVVAAQPSVAGLFKMVAGIDRVLALDPRLPLLTLSRELARERFDTALLLRNSLRAALLVALARIPERWGYRADARTPLLTRAIVRPSGLHQAEYYQQLVHALGFPNGPMEPRIAVPPPARDAAAKMLAEAGWDGRRSLVALAPGAAYGGAKRWPPANFAAVAASLGGRRVQPVIIGSAADAATASVVLHAFRRMVDDHVDDAPRLLSLVGRTDLTTLAGVFGWCRALVTNDSGAMHLAAACGTAVTAVFGSTDERGTRPLGHAHEIVTAPVWCRPCMLRECPLDHACMTGVAAATVADAAGRSIAP